MTRTDTPAFENLDGEPYLIVVLSPFSPYPLISVPASSGRELISVVRAINARYGSDLIAAAVRRDLPALVEAAHKENVGLDEALLPIFNSHFQPHNIGAPVDGILSFTRTLWQEIEETPFVATIIAGPIGLVNEHFSYLSELQNVF